MNDQKIGSLVKKLSYLLRHSVREKSDPLTSGQCFFLNYLNHNGAKCTQSELEKTFAIRRASVSSFLGNLEKGEYVFRKQNEKDKRQKDIILTDKGKALSNQVEEIVEKTEKILRNNISEDDIQKFYEIISVMISNLEARVNEEVN